MSASCASGNKQHYRVDYDLRVSQIKLYYKHYLLWPGVWGNFTWNNFKTFPYSQNFYGGKN